MAGEFAGMAYDPVVVAKRMARLEEDQHVVKALNLGHCPNDMPAAKQDVARMAVAIAKIVAV
jgi:hypothetical protein